MSTSFQGNESFDSITEALKSCGSPRGYFFSIVRLVTHISGQSGNTDQFRNEKWIHLFLELDWIFQSGAVSHDIRFQPEEDAFSYALRASNVDLRVIPYALARCFRAGPTFFIIVRYWDRSASRFGMTRFSSWQLTYAFHLFPYRL